MREKLQRAMKDGRIVEIVYEAKNGSISQRHIRVLSMKGDVMHAFCYLRGMNRVFYIDQLLAVYPVNYRQRRIG